VRITAIIIKDHIESPNNNENLVVTTIDDIFLEPYGIAVV